MDCPSWLHQRKMVNPFIRRSSQTKRAEQIPPAGRYRGHRTKNEEKGNPFEIPAYIRLRKFLTNSFLKRWKLIDVSFSFFFASWLRQYLNGKLAVAITEMYTETHSYTWFFTLNFPQQNGRGKLKKFPRPFAHTKRFWRNTKFSIKKKHKYFHTNYSMISLLSWKMVNVTNKNEKKGRNELKGN